MLQVRMPTMVVRTQTVQDKYILSDWLEYTHYMYVLSI